jgi:phospholipase/carboxylesterase
MLPIVPEPLPDLKNTPVLIVAGRYDPIIPEDEAMQLVATLRQAGAKVSVSSENAGHGLTETTVEIARRWLTERTTGESRATPDQ